MDKKSLESAIMDEAEKALRALTLKEAEEIKKLDDAYSSEINDFANRLRSQTDAKISQESSKVENRAALDLKKLKLKSVETFISHAIEEAVKSININPNYKKFIINAVVDAVGRIPDGVEVRLMNGDLATEKEIRDALKSAGKNNDITVLEDGTIKWGGCIIVDMSGGRIFDNTIERVYFRKSLLIRREVMSLLGDSPVDVA
jgi:flagellar biosynthesis/type III secretory pathway protein FliH